jgi:excisionase family DNA binding protein
MRAHTSASEALGKPPEWGNPSQANLEPQTRARPAETLTAERLLTAAQLAERWQVPKSHIYRLSRRGDVPTVRLGRYFRYRLDAIARWEEEQGNA